ncbi:MAG TPA: hypothetical protein VNZ06_03595 [Steroidobacteraceae bacterium]|nr:hypothetical protein [Steroidobacteraceae bacterium]
MTDERLCASCRHFNRAAHRLEQELPGLRSLSSAHAAVRSDDGLCSVHDRYVASYYTCPQYEAVRGE